ncbi:jg18813 [Pararge aegeria aegeria]|uniref:Jg18813 protein n=1 Tax=Pararge aegeria aegeria TaxID=348720 RepID=A0A8S4QRU1_9NEOP|nr:jg18813 [Pararge aegeria aegeria]
MITLRNTVVTSPTLAADVVRGGEALNYLFYDQMQLWLAMSPVCVLQSARGARCGRHSSETLKWFYKSPKAHGEHRVCLRLEGEDLCNELRIARIQCPEFPIKGVFRALYLPGPTPVKNNAAYKLAALSLQNDQFQFQATNGVKDSYIYLKTKNHRV